MEEFSIELGAKLKLDSLQEQINKASSNLKPLEITINTEKSEKKITALTEQISKLNNGFKIMENMGSLSSNLDVIDKSLRSIATVIDKINKADGFNNLGKGLSSFAPAAEMIKNELSSIKTAMESFKGFNLNFDIKPTIGKDALSVAKENALFELRQQLNAIESVYMQYTKAENVIDAAVRAFRGTEFATKNNVLKSGLIAHDESLTINQQISAVQNYINMLQQGAKTIEGINLTSVTSTFTKTADEIVASASKINSGEQMLSDETNQLKKIFGSGVDAEKLTTQLDTIKVSIDNVSTAISGIKFDDSTLQTFKETIGSLNTTIKQLSESITELDGKPIISKTATTGIAQTTQEIQKAEVETQKLKQITEQATKIDGSSTLAGKQTIEEFESEINHLIYDEKELENKTKDFFGSIGNVTTNVVRGATNEITSFSVAIQEVKNKLTTGVTETLRFSLKTNGDNKNYKYQGASSSDNYARQQAAISKQAEKNTVAIKEYEAELKKIQDDYSNGNASKPITTKLEELNRLHAQASGKVKEFASATKESYPVIRAEVEALITDLREQVKIARDIDTFSAQLRAKPLETIKKEQIQLLNEFETKIKSSGIELSKFKSLTEMGGISGLRTKIEGADNKQSIVEYLNMMSVAKAELKALQTEQRQTTKEQTALFNELSKVGKEMDSIQIKLQTLKSASGTNEHTEQIKELERQLAKLETVYQEVMTQINNNGGLTDNQYAKIYTDIEMLDAKLKEISASAVDAQNKLKSSIKTDISNGTLKNQIQTIENDYRKLGLTEDEIAQKTQTLKTLLNTMEASDDIESVTKDYTAFGQEVVKVQNDVKALRREQQKAKDEANLANGKNTLSSQIDVWLKKNSAAASEFGVRLREIQQELLTADGTKLTALKREFQEIKRQAELAGKATMTLGDKLKSKLGSLATYFSATMMISYAIQGVRAMYQNVLDVDTAMTELYRVTDLTGQQYNQLYDKMVAGAKEYGIALNNIIEATASWVRLGFDANTANQLAEISAMYQHVTDLDNDTAVKNLVTAYKGYQEELLQVSNGDSAKAMMRVADIYDKLGEMLPVRNYIG